VIATEKPIDFQGPITAEAQLDRSSATLGRYPDERQELAMLRRR